MFKATIKYRDEWSRGQWRDHSVTAETAERALSKVFAHCADCEHGEPVVVEIPD